MFTVTMSWLARANCEDAYPGPRILLTLSVLRSPSVFWIGHSGSEKLMKRCKGKELSTLLPKSLSPLLSVSELQAPPLCHRDNSYSPYFSETIWGSNSNGILGLSPWPLPLSSKPFLLANGELFLTSLPLLPIPHLLPLFPSTFARVLSAFCLWAMKSTGLKH